jgi:hypothetical protein
MVGQCIGRASGGQADTSSLACRRTAWNNRLLDDPVGSRPQHPPPELYNDDHAHDFDTR